MKKYIIIILCLAFSYILNAQNSKILVVYFSRVGNTQFDNNVDASTAASIVANNNKMGTTEYVANVIKNQLNADIRLIETVNQYSKDFDDLVDKNHDEMRKNDFPKIKPLNIDISKYNTIFIGYPVWANDVPMAVRTFIRDYNLSSKTIIPFCTHDGYGAGRSYSTIRNMAKNANVLDGLALDSSNIESKNNQIINWISKLNLKK
ncbi:flavodoxin [Brachyspira alvinipulli]|uniref:flavodoxin n=1 Tax=Brachyspira alvinipulli TaxID=84379 RepID=UPI000483458F|nr:flavodoxin [Brachyspira alvinipulli]